MRYFVTGGVGFIGSNYVGFLLSEIQRTSLVTIYDAFTYASNPKNYSEFQNDPRLKIIKGDICNSFSLEREMYGHDFVIHFAAESHVDRSIADPAKFIQTNVLGTFQVLEAARRVGIQTVILVSTDEVYGSIETGSADETYSLNPNSPYSASKAAGDLLARSYFITHGLDVRVTRSCNNYGKFQFPEKVIPVFIRTLLSGNPVPIYGDGQNVREWIHVSDHCKGIQLVLESGLPGEIYNIGSGTLLTNNDLASLIISTLGLSDNMKSYVDDRKGHDYRYSINSSKINALGFKPEVGFSLGILETVEWYSKHENWWLNSQST